MADLAQARGLEMPALPDAAYQRMHAVLGDKVTVANPLDYHTYIWGDRAALAECFAGLMDCRFDAHILVLDYPRLDRCSADSWGAALDAFADAASLAGTDTGATVVASLPEDFPEDIAHTLLARGVAPMQGLADCIAAIGHAADIGAASARLAHTTPLAALVLQSDAGPVRTLDEAAGKAALAAYGLPVPRGRVVAADDVLAFATKLGFPVVLKAVSDQLAHKTEAGGVALNLGDAAALSEALARMAHLSERFLVEEMACDVVLELIVGVQRDAQFGLTLTLGAGGVLVELLQDATTLLFPVARQDILAALQSLKVWPLLTGFRGKAAGDVDALLDAVMAVTDYAQSHAAQLVELDVNPVLVLPKGRGVLAVDALIRLKTP
jgi:acetyl-CoA synthetase